MKKLFTLITAVLVSLATMATTYTGTLTVTINGQSGSQDGVNIDIVKEDGGTYALTLKNFILGEGEEMMPVGNIALTGINATTKGYLNLLDVDQEVAIQDGDLEGVDWWYGPLLGNVPLKMIAYFVDYSTSQNYLAVDIDIDMMDQIGQIISVHFENEIPSSNAFPSFQIPNSDFEEWTTKTTEPRYWHGFESGYGSLLDTSQKAKLTQSTDCHGGSYSAVSTASATKFLFMSFTINGTFTNGLLKANKASTTSTENHSEMGPSTDSEAPTIDKNGDAYFTPLYAAPDAITAWMKMSTKSKTSKANFSAIAFDGTYYQDPEDKTYTNVAAKAQEKNAITMDAGYDSWKQVNVPFNYADDDAINKAKAILVTFSTNSTGGSGSEGDKVFVDDIELVYYNRVTDIKLNGETLTGFSEDVHEYFVEINPGDEPSIDDIEFTALGASSISGKYMRAGSNGYTATVYAISPKMEMNKYVINFLAPTAMADVTNAGAYIVTEGNVVAFDDETQMVYTTDGEENWLPIKVADADLYAQAKAAGTLSHFAGKFDASETAPTFTATAFNAAGAFVKNSQEIYTFNLADDKQELNPKAGQVIKIQGIWHNGELRGYSGANGGNRGRSFTVLGATDALVEGTAYTIPVAVSLKEAWGESEEPAGAPKRVAKEGDATFQNLQGKIVGGADMIEGVSTAVTDINSDAAVVSTRYFNVEGRELAEPAQGVTIVVNTLSDGTVKATKVLK